VKICSNKKRNFLRENTGRKRIFFRQRKRKNTSPLAQMEKSCYLCGLLPKSSKMAQLNQMQRYAIYLYLKEKKTQAYIAGMLNVSKSTISRELKRNGGKRGYSWRQAQELADLRKERLKEPRKMCGQVRRRIEEYMRKEQLSPEQIVGLCRNEGHLMVSKSSIYNYIRKDKEEGGDLWENCRFRLKHRRRPVGKYIPIKNRVGIELRPPEADGSRFGDWEMDLMSDSEGKNFKLTLVERSTLFSIIRNLHNGKVAIDVAKTVVDALLPFKRGGGVKTITTDNGTEFYEHEYITRKLGAPVYFTNPYCSWQKGCIENTNMLYRQYLPRDRSFAIWSDDDILELQHKLNRRPRKKIGFDLPYRKFYLSLQS